MIHSEDLKIRQAIAVKKVKNEDEVPLKIGDLLLEINGQSVSRRIDLIRALNRETIDQNITILIERNGEKQVLVALAKAKVKP